MRPLGCRPALAPWSPVVVLPEERPSWRVKFPQRRASDRSSREAHGCSAVASCPYDGNVNDKHLELLRSDLWRELLSDFIIPFALGDLTWANLGDEVLECGPGPGLTTEVLRSAGLNVTAIELDAALAGELQQRLPDVEVCHGDATAMPFETGRFSAVVCFTMLHHIPTPDLQDAMFAEVCRVLRPGGIFLASDSVASKELAELHDGDVYNPIPPDSVTERLVANGFGHVDVRSNAFGWACHARPGL